jgi:hypothetical protein
MQFANATIWSGLAAPVDGSWDEPHAASPAAAMMARRVILRMWVVYATGGNTTVTAAVTST